MPKTGQRLDFCFADERLKELIAQFGPMADCHRHLDRQWTLDEEGMRLIRAGATLPEKWEHIKKAKANPRYLDTMEARIRLAAENMIAQGINYCRTYIDVDSEVGLSALARALRVKQAVFEGHGFVLQVAASPVAGINDKLSYTIFKEGCRLADAVGGLPSRGRSGVDDYKTSEQGMELLFEIALELGKPLDMQIDQANHPRERESAILCELASKYRALGYQLPVTAVHCVSLAAQKDCVISDIARCFALLNIGVVCCPSAAIDMKQERAEQAPTHNSIAPVIELAENGVVVGLGSDNVSDMFMPLATGRMMEELRLLAYAVRRQYDLEFLAKIATVNGRKILGEER